ADREVEDLEGVPAAKGDKALGQGLVVPPTDSHVRAGAVGRLEVRAQRVGMEGRCAEPRRHALGEEPVVVGPRDEVPPGAPYRADPAWDGGEQLLQAAAPPMPELVRIRVQDPVRREV